MPANEAQAPAPATPAPVPAGVQPAAPVEGQPPQAAAPAQDPKLSPAFAKLAAEQKRAREAQQALKAERERFEADRKAHEAELAGFRAFKELKANAKRMPLKYLETAGLTYQDVTEAQVAGGEPTPGLEVKALKDDLEELKQTQAKRDAEAAEAAKRAAADAQAKAVADFKGQLAAQVKSAGEKFEYLNEFGMYDAVFEVIEAHAQAQADEGTPANEIKLLSWEEAAAAVEKRLEEQAEKLSKTKKFSAKAAPPAAPPAPEKRPVVKFNAPTQATTPKTLSNNLTGATAAASRTGRSWAERERAAEEILRQARATQ